MSERRGGQWDGTASRLKLLRTALFNESAAAFSKRIGLTYDQYLNFERSYPLSRDAALAIVRRVPGVTLDWLFLGERRGLAYDIIEKIDAASQASRRW